MLCSPRNHGEDSQNRRMNLPISGSLNIVQHHRWLTTTFQFTCGRCWLVSHDLHGARQFRNVGAYLVSWTPTSCKLMCCCIGSKPFHRAVLIAYIKNRGTRTSTPQYYSRKVGWGDWRPLDYNWFCPFAGMYEPVGRQAWCTKVVAIAWGHHAWVYTGSHVSNVGSTRSRSRL